MMKAWRHILSATCLFYVMSVLASDIAEDALDADTPRQKKLFSLFSIVTFKNSGCRGTGGSNDRNGTCYTSTECQNKGGLAQGNCAAGFGVCCLFIVSSTSRTISENCTYIQNPGFPSAYPDNSALTFMVNKCSSDVCSIRLDFVTFQTLGPVDTAETNGGICRDMLVASGTTGHSSPVICGLNTGQHIYMDVGPASGATASLAFSFANTASTTRMWEIKATQVECSSPSRPESGCLQQHYGLTGRIQTFNFADAAAQQHLASQKYSICIRPEKGYCCIQYSPCADANSWSIDALIAANSEAGTTCAEDYIEIDGLQDKCQTGSIALTISRLCGGKFNFWAAPNAISAASVCDCSQPFNVIVKTVTAAELAAGPNRGACLEYKQRPCATS